MGELRPEKLAQMLDLDMFKSYVTHRKILNVDLRHESCQMYRKATVNRVTKEEYNSSALSNSGQRKQRQNVMYPQ